MKNSVRRVARYVCGLDWLWDRLPRAISSHPYLSVQRKAAQEERFQRLLKSTFEASLVIGGPFKGLRYPNQVSVGSALYPKLIGSYESELHQYIETFCERSYSKIIDIGFAEGYYLIGFGVRMPTARLVGFDISKEAHLHCAALAAANGIPKSHIDFHEACSHEALRQILPCPSLIVVDCEGFEADLFTPNTADIWRESDLLIECHDFIRPGVTAALLSFFQRTHEVRVIQSDEVDSKLHWLSGSQFCAFRPEDRQRLLSEGRPVRMNWLVIESIQKRQPVVGSEV